MPVSTSGDTGETSSKVTMMVTSTLSAADAQHREAFKQFVVESAEPWHREHLGTLYERWAEWNDLFFAGSMVAPYILFSVTNYTGALGDYSTVSGFGGRGQIRIRESLLTGTHRAVRGGEKFAEGRFKFVEDVLLHETIHQYQHEVLAKPEKSFKGHGSIFRDKCNEIGAKLDLSPVRVAKARGKCKNLPSCAQWPHCVRPSHYYLGAQVEGGAPGGGDGAEEEADSDDRPVKIDKLETALNVLTAAAQQYAQAWPVGSEEESALLFAGGRFRGGAAGRRLAALCNAARDFSDALQ